jgi:hypothetical protein
MKKIWGMHAIWLPGKKLKAGDIVQRSQDGTYERVGNLKQDFAITTTKTRSESLKTGFKSAGTKTRLIQAGVDVSQAQVKAEAKAEIEFEFTKSESFSVATPVGTVETLDNLLGIAAKIAALDGWNHRRWLVVREVLTVKGFTVLCSSSAGKKIKFSGKGKAVLDFVNFGLSAGITRSGSSSVDVEFVGKNGALAMDLAKIRKNGFVVVG